MIALIAAMPVEQETITARMTNVEVSSEAGSTFYKGRLADEEVVVVLAGVGKVNAAVASTLVCERFDPDALISIGVAGGLKQEQEVGDLVLSSAAIQADFDTSFIDGPEGLGLRFEADASMIERAKKAAEKAGLRYSTGVVATQDLFMAHEDDYARLMSRFEDCACSEMEGGAIAQVATRFKLPFLVIRTLSDVVVHDDNPVEFTSFAASSAKKAAEFLEIFCTDENA